MQPAELQIIKVYYKCDQEPNQQAKQYLSTPTW